MAENSSWLKKGVNMKRSRLAFRPNYQNDSQIGLTQGPEDNDLRIPPPRKSSVMNMQRIVVQVPKEKKDNQQRLPASRKSIDPSGRRMSMIPCRPSILPANRPPQITISSARQPLRQLSNSNVTLKFSTPRQETRGILSAPKYGSSHMKNVSFELLQESVITNNFPNSSSDSKVDASTNTDPLVSIQAASDACQLETDRLEIVKKWFYSEMQGVLQHFEQFMKEIIVPTSGNVRQHGNLEDIPETSENITPVSNELTNSAGTVLDQPDQRLNKETTEALGEFNEECLDSNINVHNVSSSGDMPNLAAIRRSARTVVRLNQDLKNKQQMKANLRKKQKD